MSRPKTYWQRTYGHKRPASRWARQADRRAWKAQRRETTPCSYCSARFDAYGARQAHEYAEHRAKFLFAEIRQCELSAKYLAPADAVDPRYWAFHQTARRYRRLLRAWWALDTAEYSTVHSRELAGRPLLTSTSPGRPWQMVLPLQGSGAWYKAVTRARAAGTVIRLVHEHDSLAV